MNLNKYILFSDHNYGDIMKNIIHIAAIADIHFGANFTQTIGLSAALKKHFINKLLESPPDIIVLGGDLFDKKLSVNSPEAVLCNEFILSLHHQFPNTYKLLIKGTRAHDLDQLNLFKPLVNEYFRIYEKVTIDFILGMKLLIIPEEYYSSKSFYDTYLKAKEPYDFVFFHGLFSHVGNYAKASNMNKICFNWEDFRDNVYGKVVGGHIHKRISYKNIEYINSFDRWSHGEEEDKGYLYIIYDVKKKKVLSLEYIINEDAHKYITIYYKDIFSLSTDDLVKTLSELSKGVKSLRIKVEKDDPLTEDKLHTLLTISFNIPHLVIDKKAQMHLEDNEVSMEKQKELEERKNEIAKYDKLTFEEITIKFAKDKLNATISDDDIKEVFIN
jgi:DNA repair exonuclease SbcCD nuclease subunit